MNRYWPRLKKNISLILGTGIVAFLMLIMLISFFYTPYPPNQMHARDRFSPPSQQYLLGTDNFGRDILSRIMRGSQTAFLVGAVSVSIALLLGLLLGAWAGYFGGCSGEVIMRLMDALMSLPGILIALVFAAVFGPGIINTTIALGIMAIPTFTRISRGGFLQYREQDFALAAKALGAGSTRIIFRHILPNARSPLIIAASLGFATAVLAESALSYLGLGVQPPHPSWGRMLSEAQSFYRIAPWYPLAPGVFITLLVLGFNLLGDGLRDFFDPRG